ncbi:MAG: hypothetical protein CO093_08350 [Alphaproteobacteria bacterium CG_4_9_14_3_um_filter_47_13]|nr:MAG: hypothetical protein CO093_08350 [Alphaproteobacteria bacterium CG_4_9_14_3_um_filter_47_13]
MNDNFNEKANPQALFTIPTVISQTENGNAIGQDVFSRLLSDNIVYITGANSINATMSDTVVASLFHLYYDKIKPLLQKAGKISDVPEEQRTIKMMINSPGGSVSDGLQIYDLMQLLKSDGVIIETHVSGIAMSMGSVLLVGGSEGHRHAWPSASIMLHQASGSSRGTAKDAAIGDHEFQYVNERMKSIYRAHTNMTDKEIDKIFDRDYFIRGEEAKALGIIDDVLYPENLPKVAAEMKKENMRHWTGEKPEGSQKIMRLRPPSNDTVPTTAAAPKLKK